MVVSSSLAVTGAAKAGDAIDLASGLIEDMLVGDCGFVSIAASRAATGSRGTSDFGGCALREGGSKDSDRSRAGLWRDFFISSLSWRRACRARSSSTLMSSGLTFLTGSGDLVRLLRLALSRSLSLDPPLSLSRSLSRPQSLSLSLSRSGVLLRARLLR